MRKVRQLLMVMVMMVSVLLDVGVTVAGKIARTAFRGVEMSLAVAMACAGGLLMIVVLVHSLD